MSTSCVVVRKSAKVACQAFAVLDDSLGDVSGAGRMRPDLEEIRCMTGGCATVRLIYLVNCKCFNRAPNAATDFGAQSIASAKSIVKS